MKTHRFACVFLFCFGFNVLAARADVYVAGDSIAGFKANDQHGAEFTYKPGDARFILFDTPGENGASESPKDPDWFEKNHALLVVNLSELSGFKRKIALSRVATKQFRLLVVEDSGVAARFPKQSGKFTVVQLDEGGKIVAIRFAAPGKDVKELVEANGR